jgi:CHASE3 domain sensor protein
MPDEEGGPEAFKKRIGDALGGETLKNLQRATEAASKFSERVRAAAAASPSGIPGMMEPNQVRLDDEIQQTISLARLVDLNKESRAQLVALAQITGAALEESQQLRETMTTAAEEQPTATTWIIRFTVAVAILTAVLVVLTYLLVADAIGWWPFAGAVSRQ